MESSCKSCNRPLNVAEQKEPVRCFTCHQRLCGDCQSQACAGCDTVMCAACLSSCAGDCTKKFCKACLTTCSNPKCRNCLCASCLAFFILPCSKCDRNICKICALCSSCSGECRQVTCEECAPPVCLGDCGDRFCAKCAERCLNFQICGNTTFCSSCISACRGGCGRKLCKSCGQACRTCGGCICGECSKKLTCSGKDCSKLFCPTCVPVTCKRCNGAFCTECVVNCSGCDRPTCLTCSHSCCAPGCKRRLCDNCLDSELVACQNKCGQFFCSPCARTSLRNACSGPCGGSNFCRSCLSTCQGDGCQARFCSSCLKNRYSCYTCNLVSLCYACASRDHFSHNCFATVRPTRNEGEPPDGGVDLIAEEEAAAIEEGDEDGSRALKRRLRKNKSIVYLFADDSRYIGEMNEHVPHGKGVWMHPRFHRVTFDAEIGAEKTADENRIIVKRDQLSNNIPTKRRGSSSSSKERTALFSSVVPAFSELPETKWESVGGSENMQESALPLPSSSSSVTHSQRVLKPALKRRRHLDDFARVSSSAVVSSSPPLLSSREVAAVGAPVSSAVLLFFEGDWVRGQKCGEGRATYLNGMRYRGFWQESKRHGRGELINGSLRVYEGEWAADSKHGNGIQRLEDGSVYEGQWHENKRHGTGKLTDKEGEYSGEWKEDKRDGQGTQVYASDNTTYKGQWQANERHGKGRLSEAFDEAWQEGSWKNGQRSGTFTFTWTDGVVILQYFRKDVMVAERALPLSESNLSILALRQHLTSVEAARGRLASDLTKTQASHNGLKKDLGQIKTMFEKTTEQLERRNVESVQFAAENAVLKTQLEQRTKEVAELNATLTKTMQSLDKLSEKATLLEREEKGAKLRLEKSGVESKKTIETLTSQLQVVTEKYNLRKQQLRQLLPLQQSKGNQTHLQQQQQQQQRRKKTIPSASASSSSSASASSSSSAVVNDVSAAAAAVTTVSTLVISAHTNTHVSTSDALNDHEELHERSIRQKSSSSSSTSRRFEGEQKEARKLSPQKAVSKTRDETEDVSQWSDEEKSRDTRIVEDVLWNYDLSPSRKRKEMEEEQPKRYLERTTHRPQTSPLALTSKHISSSSSSSSSNDFPVVVRTEERVCACGLRFEFSYQLRVHQKREGHTNPDPNKPLPSAPGHERINNEKKPSHQQRRVQTESGEKTFICSFPGCGKQYAWKQGLAAHQRASHGSHSKKTF